MSIRSIQISMLSHRLNASLIGGAALLSLGLALPTQSLAQDAEPEDSPAAAPEPAAAPAAPAEESKLQAFMQKFTVGVGMRTGLDVTFAGDNVDDVQLRLSDGLVDQVNIRPFMQGNLTENISFFTQLEIGTPNGLGAFAVLDAVGQIRFMDELQLWVGQHIPANDRNNMNGPFFGNTWNFAITVPSYGFDVGARDRGATLWGLIAGGVLKYHLSLVDLQPGQAIQHSRFAGRVTLNLLDPENYYYASGTYWGSQDTLAIGAVYHHQSGVDVVLDPSDPSAPPGKDNDFDGFSFDLFFEKRLGASGTFTLEGGYWNWKNVGKHYVVNQGTVDVGRGVVGPLPGQAYMGVVSWLMAEPVGVGRVQFNARAQYGDYDASQNLTLDFGLAYVVDGFNHKYHVNYRHENIDPVGAPAFSADSIQFGMQYMMAR